MAEVDPGNSDKCSGISGLCYTGRGQSKQFGSGPGLLVVEPGQSAINTTAQLPPQL